jgi:ArsR family transcriptional regulator, arsenate/arsenite/antimonite-responsive transcriptional repressor
MVNQGLEACGRPVSAGALSVERSELVARAFKALGDPVRLRLFSMIASGGGEVCVCELTGAFELKAPTISHHLKVLREAGLVDCERRGTWVYYWGIPGAVETLSRLLDVRVPA